MDPATLDSLEVVLAAAVFLLGGLVAETRVFPRTWVPLYHDVGLPLGVALPPIADRPSGSGDTASVAWAVTGDRVRFAARPGERRVPAGLHGAVRFRETPRGLQMNVVWSPPWTLGLALLWAGVVAVVREDLFLVPVLVVGAGVLGAMYWSQARRIAVELRMAFSRRTTRDDVHDRG